jgi:hypothetical protein
VSETPPPKNAKKGLECSFVRGDRKRKENQGKKVNEKKAANLFFSKNGVKITLHPLANKKCSPCNAKTFDDLSSDKNAKNTRMPIQKNAISGPHLPLLSNC